MLTPGWLNLDSLSIIRLAATLLSLAIFIYLLQVPRTSVATLFLALAFFGAFLFHTATFFEFAGPYNWQPRNVRTVLVSLFTDIGPSLAMVFLLLFAYYFPRFRAAERREFRIVLVITITLNAGVFGFNVYNHFVLQWRFSDTRLWDTYWLVFYCSLALQFLGATALLIRKTTRLSGRGPRSCLGKLLRPNGRDAAAARALAAVLLLPLAAVITSLAVTYRFVPFFLATYVTWVVLLLFYLCFVVTYLNHSADPLNLQVKLLGVTLILILSTMGLVGLFVGETSAREYPAPRLPASHSMLRFTPNGVNGYEVRQAPWLFDPDLGGTVEVQYERPRAVSLGFDFPFFSGRYRTVQVLNGPMIYLGETIREKGWGGYNPQPAIAPLIMNLDPSKGGGIHVKSAPDSTTITWFRLPELGAENSNTVQLVLRVDGTIDMRFEDLSPVGGPSIEQLYDYAAASTSGENPAPGGRPAPFPPRLTGIHPGGPSARLSPISFARDLPWSAAGPSVIFESYEAGFTGYLTARIGVLAALTLLTSLLMLFLIPLLLRTSLFRPLRALAAGMRRVEEGDLGAVVKAPFRDEIGFLARSFNRMVGGLRERFELMKYVSDGTKDAVKTTQEPRRVLCTLLFTDVRGFTSYAERRTPEHVLEVLSRLLERQSEIIQDNGGDIDKFVGDEIVAVFSGDGAAAKACAAARGIMEMCARDASRFERLTVGAGIATGPVIQGKIGSTRRADFTVIGDSVNLASRLCGMAKGSRIVVSDAARREVGSLFRFRGPFFVSIRGKSQAQRVWLLHDRRR
ncbi:MAG TPA: adenylate/guanylate cyclase domain-containing protein [Spirochaetia bacterium]|nr:adenylate/guanylate cyclase domain-containing protein [Spirochaetia bacterium]